MGERQVNYRIWGKGGRLIGYRGRGYVYGIRGRGLVYRIWGEGAGL